MTVLPSGKGEGVSRIPETQFLLLIGYLALCGPFPGMPRAEGDPICWILAVPSAPGGT